MREALPSLHYLTPETESTTHYFVAASRNWQQDDPAEEAYIGDLTWKYQAKYWVWWGVII